MVEISVVIPVYNTENYLKECLNSICNQTFNNIEILCINDGSTDSSLEILEKYQKKDKRISIISQENSGLSITRNNGIRIANGKYIYFIDSDDYLELTALEELYNISEEKNLDMLIFKLINFDDGTDNKYTSKYYEMDAVTYLDDKVFNYKEIGDDVFNFAVSTPGKFFKRDLLKDLQFPENLIFEDNYFFAQAMLKAERVSFYNRHLYNRRIRPDSITTSKTIKFADSITIINMIIDLAKQEDVYDIFKYGLARKKIDIGLFRYSDIDDEYKEEFFDRLKNDFESYKEEYENEIFEKLDDRQKNIFTSVISSNNHNEFDLRRETYLLKKENASLNKENRELKNQNEDIKKKVNCILSSKSWAITKPLRHLFALFKK